MQELSSPPSDQSIEAAVQTIDATLARLRAQPEEPSADMHQTVLQTQLKMMQEPVRSQGNFAGRLVDASCPQAHGYAAGG